jgi:hypothetical protein
VPQSRDERDDDGRKKQPSSPTGRMLVRHAGNLKTANWGDNALSWGAGSYCLIDRRKFLCSPRHNGIDSQKY